MDGACRFTGGNPSDSLTEWIFADSRNLRSETNRGRKTLFEDENDWDQRRNLLAPALITVTLITDYFGTTGPPRNSRQDVA